MLLVLTTTFSEKVAIVPSSVGEIGWSGLVGSSARLPDSGAEMEIVGSTPKFTLVLDESLRAEALLAEKILEMREELDSVSAMPPPPEGGEG